MAVTILPKKNVLGTCNPFTKTITIYPPKKALKLDKNELKRLTKLGECCIKVAQTLGDKKARKIIEEFNLENYGNKEYPYYETDMHYFFGIIRGLEIYATQLYDGPRYVAVYNNNNLVFDYNCLDSDEFDNVENPQITKYIRGSWELKVLEWYKKARNILDKKVLTIEDSRF
jgi:hypothetical protein